MTSFDYRLDPIYAIKECSSCGSLYTSNCGCSKGSLEDKILVPIPDSSQRPLKIENFCLDCGDPIHGLHCQGCALIRKTFEEVLQDFQDTSESSDDNTNVVNAPREPFVVKHNPGENSSPSPPHIDHCCHECGDSLDGIFCRQCTCKSCGKGAHYGYNCPPRVPIISNPEPCKNQTIGEHLQNLQRLQQQCLLGKLTWNTNQCFNSDSSNDSPSVANFLTIPIRASSCEYIVGTILITTIIDSNDDSTSSDDDSYENIDYVDASPRMRSSALEVVEDVLSNNPAPSSDVMTKSSSTSLNLFLEETNTFDNSSPEAETLCFDLEEINSGSSTTRSDYSLPDYEAFYSDDDHIKEKNKWKFPDCEDSHAHSIHMSFTSSASFWESRTDISQKDEKPSKKRQNRTRDGKVCEDEAQSKSSQLREEKAKKNIT
ncbi:hypothetical protein Tco_1345066 [Tanacetum coccineum]